MLQKLDSATLEKYNANNRGKNVGDCVKRSMSLAFDLSYTEISKLLNAKMKEMRKTAWNIKAVFEAVIKELGGSDYIPNTDPTLTVDDFTDNVAQPDGTYLLLVGKKYGQTSHLVCIRDKKVWDSWDSRDHLVTGYYTIGNDVARKQFTDIKDHLVELQDDYVHPTLFNELEKFMNKRTMEGEVNYSYQIRAYTIISKWFLRFDPDEILSKQRNYSFKIPLTFEPTMTFDDAVKYIQTIGKTRMYDRMYAIYNEEKKLVEIAKIESKLSPEARRKSPYFEAAMSDKERRFYNSLPGWAKALIHRIDIQSPNQYHDSYTIGLNTLPDDNLHPKGDAFQLYGYNADEIKEKLDHYYKTYEIEGIDYYQDW